MNSSQTRLEFPAVSGKEVIACFDGGDLTSDGGLLLLKEADRKFGITDALVSEAGDQRQQGKVKHALAEMIRARVYGVALGYSDCNDMDFLRHDPALKVSCGRTPSGEALASQPTYSRMENAISARDLKQMFLSVGRVVLEQVPADTEEVILEVDATDDPCHGQQQLQLFNGYYDKHCYVPLLVHLVEPSGRRHLLFALLRPGNASSGKGLFGTMREAIRLVRERLGKKVRIVVRADSGFGSGKFMDFLTSQKVDFVLGLPKNVTLSEKAIPAHMRAAVAYRFKGNGYRVFDEFRYIAKKNWTVERRVVVKVEITQGELNPRYVVTSLEGGSAQDIYGFYCARGEQENRIKEFKLDMDSGRTSCSRFDANRFRLLTHTAAYALLNGVRGLLSETEWKNTQMGILRLRLLKVGARVVESARKVWFHLPTSYPNQREWEYLFEKLRLVTPGG
jgi:hypothetical protein